MLLGVAIVFAFGLHFWFHGTRWGQACLAVAEDREAATLRGINVNLLSLGGFAAAGALGHGQRVRDRADHVRDPDAGEHAGARRRSSRSPWAARVASWEACSADCWSGLVSAFATRYIGANYSDLAVLALLLVTLLVRPTGLGAAAEARRV